MSIDVCKYIEVYTPDYNGYVFDKNDLNHIGKFQIGDVMMVYNNDKYNYWKIIDVVNGEFVYRPVLVNKMEDHKAYMDFISSLDIVYRCDFYDNLPKKQLPCSEGVIYKYYDNGEHYVKMRNGKWVEIKGCSYSWKQVKWKDKHNYIVSGCSSFIDNYVFNRWNSTNSQYSFSDRGLPKDLSEGVKSEICKKHDFGFTYTTLNEIDKCCRNDYNKVKEYVLKYIVEYKDSQINKKLDIIMDKLFGNKDQSTKHNNDEVEVDEEYDEFDDMFSEFMTDFEVSTCEYKEISTLVEQMHGYVSDENVRVIYSFNN